MLKRKWARLVAMMLVAVQLMVLLPAAVWAEESEPGVGSAVVTQEEIENTQWQIFSGGEITTPVWQNQTVWGTPTLSLAAVPEQTSLLEDESASVNLTTSVTAEQTQEFDDEFTISFSGRTRNSWVNSTTLNRVIYRFTRDGETISKTVEFDLRMEAGGANIITASHTFSITELGLTPGEYAVTFEARGRYSLLGTRYTTLNANNFGSIVIPELADVDVNKPEFPAFEYSVNPVSGYDITVADSAAQISRTVNADSTDHFIATVSGINTVDGIEYSADSTFTLAGVRNNLYTFTADSDKLAQDIPSDLASQTVATGDVVNVPTPAVRAGWQFAGWEPVIALPLIADGSDYAYHAVIERDGLPPVIQVSDETGFQGEDISVNVTATNIIDLAGIKVALNYDPDSLILKQVELASTLGAAAVNDTIAGKIIFNAVNAQGITAAEALLATLIFESAPGFIGSTGIGFDSIEAVDSQFYNIDLEQLTGSVTIEEVPVTLYTVTVAEVEGGSITANLASGEAGTVIELTVTPEEGWQLVEGSLSYSDGVESYAISGNSFVLPAANVTVTAEFEEIAAPVVTDVTFSGETVVGQILETHYEYVSSVPEEGTTFRWLVANHGTGEYEAIEGATERTFTVTSAFAGRDIAVEVTPANIHGEGEAVVGHNGNNQVTLSGDLNNDGTVSFVDAIRLIQLITNEEDIAALDAKTRAVADANKDGFVDILDVIAILQADVGLLNLN